MSPQEMFDKAWKELLPQGPSALPDGTCLYRAPGGRKCAAGIFISDDKYTNLMEGKDVSTLNRRFGLGFSTSQIHVLVALQEAHDNAARDVVRAGLKWDAAFKDRMARAAWHLGLKFNP